MASYAELYGIWAENSDLRNKVTTAVVEAARTVSAGEDTTDPPWDQTAPQPANRRLWAKRALEQPVRVAREMFFAMLVDNKGSTKAAIEAADDVTIQASVNKFVDLFADGS